MGDIHPYTRRCVPAGQVWLEPRRYKCCGELKVTGQTVRLAVAGLALGLAAALASTRMLDSLLYGVTATDPATFFAVAALVFGIAMLATLAPVRRATAIQPVEALRHD
jgi:hypothetical protein